MTEKQSNYLSYLLRLWRDSETGPWRASLETPECSTPQAFSSLEALIAFLETQTGETIPRSEPQAE